MSTRIFLGLSAIAWLLFGIYGFFQPGYLEQAAGVSSGTPTGTIELRATYGGIPIGVGALALLAVLRPLWVHPALVALAFLCAGLGGARLLASVAASELSSYTAFALVFELGSAAVAWWLLSRESPDAAA
jgi:uncharacterized protein DUF4345